MTKNRSIVFAVLIMALFMTASCEKIKSTLWKKEVQSQISDKEGSFKGCFSREALSQEDALKYLGILTEGDAETISYYKEYGGSGKEQIIASGLSMYQNDVCTTVGVLSQEQNSGAYDLILRIIEQKTGYPRAMSCAIRAVMIYGEFKNGKWHGDKRSIPFLKKIINNEDLDIRLNAAGALLSLGDGDTALPALEEIAKAGKPQSLPALGRLFAPVQKPDKGRMRTVLSDTKLFDERGKDILIDALDYSGDEVRIFAALRLVGMGLEKERAEKTALEILKSMKNKDYKEYDAKIRDRRTGIQAIVLLERLESKDAIEILEDIVQNNDDVQLQKWANKALQSMQENKNKG